MEAKFGPLENITGEDLVNEIDILIGDYKTEYSRVHRFERAQQEYDALIANCNPEDPLTRLRIKKVERDLQTFRIGIIGLRDTYKMAFAMQYLYAKYNKAELPSYLADELDNMNAETSLFTQRVLDNLGYRVSHLRELLGETNQPAASM